MTATLALLLVAALWGGTFVAIKEGLGDASPLLFVGLRFLIATLAALPLAASRASLVEALRTGIPLGVVLSVGYVTQTIGLVTITPARSAFLTGLNVCLVPLWAAVVLRRWPPTRSLTGLLLALPGLWLVTTPGRVEGTPGEAWTIACAVAFALHVALVARWGRSADTAALVVVQLGTTALLALVASPLVEPMRLDVTPRLVGALLATGILATAGTTWLQLRYQPRVDPTRAALLYATEPVFAALFAAAWGETVDVVAWSGGGLIVAGAILSEWGPRRGRRRGAPAVSATPAARRDSRPAPDRSARPPSRSRPS